MWLIHMITNVFGGYIMDKQFVSYEKIMNLFLYIANAKPDFKTFEIIQIMFQSDLLAYAKSGESITGATYRKCKEGVYSEDINEVVYYMSRCGLIKQEWVKEHPTLGILYL